MRRSQFKACERLRNKATVDFYEIAYSRIDHAEAKRTLYTAHFVFLFPDSVPNELIEVNPLGLVITDFR